jgi:hypothetical protein
MEDPSIQKVIDNESKPSRELAYSFYILWICSHAHAMRQRNILSDNDWAGWLQWMRNIYRVIFCLPDVGLPCVIASIPLLRCMCASRSCFCNSSLFFHVVS